MGEYIDDLFQDFVLWTNGGGGIPWGNTIKGFPNICMPAVRMMIRTNPLKGGPVDIAM